MISAREKRIQLEASLEREENTLKQIKNSMAQSNATTQAMSRSLTVKNRKYCPINRCFSILESFGTRLDKLEKAVIPVHRETKNLQTLQDRFVIILR